MTKARNSWVHPVKSPEYRSWAAMRSRCYNKNDPKYRDYGARGITVCEAWTDFDTFVSNMGLRPDGTTLDRVDNDGNYEPGNCRWATSEEQNNNRRRHRKLTLGGKTQNVSQWARELKIPEARITSRLAAGMSVEAALERGRRIEQTAQHGMSMYRHGCRCEVCFKANSEYQKQYRKNRREE